MSKCRCGGELECMGTRDGLPRKYYRCKNCGSTYPEIYLQKCSCCEKQLEWYEKEIILNQRICHSCLIEKYILQRNELKNLKSKPNKKYDELKKRTTSIMEAIKDSAENIIDECVEITEDKIADFDECREMKLPLNHAKIIVINEKDDNE